MIEFSVDTEHPISIPAENAILEGILHIPPAVQGIVLFAHGSGSSRHSPRNQYIAHVLQHAKLGTLLFDLLTPDEDKIDATTSQFRFDIEFLANRLVAATNWVTKNPILNKLPIGYLGASTGGAAALVAAAREADKIKAVVSRGGRPDLAGEALNYVKAPTLCIVGSLDETVLALNQKAYARLVCEKKLDIVNGASHLFEEPGKLADVSQLAAQWFKHHLIK